jgi:hypothetical protein
VVVVGTRVVVVVGGGASFSINIFIDSHNNCDLKSTDLGSVGVQCYLHFAVGA